MPIRLTAVRRIVHDGRGEGHGETSEPRWRNAGPACPPPHNAGDGRPGHSPHETPPRAASSHLNGSSPVTPPANTITRMVGVTMKTNAPPRPRRSLRLT